MVLIELGGGAELLSLVPWGPAFTTRVITSSARPDGDVEELAGGAGLDLRKVPSLPTRCEMGVRTSEGSRPAGGVLMAVSDPSSERPEWRGW